MHVRTLSALNGSRGFFCHLSLSCEMLVPRELGGEAPVPTSYIITRLVPMPIKKKKKLPAASKSQVLLPVLNRLLTRCDPNPGDREG